MNGFIGFVWKGKTIRFTGTKMNVKGQANKCKTMVYN